MTAEEGDREGQALADSIRLSPIATVLSNPRLPDNPIVAANAAFCALTGYSESEIVGRNCRFLAGPETEPWRTERIREALRSLRPSITELLNYRKDGSPFRNAVLIAPLFGADGEVAWFLGSQVEADPGPGAPLALREQRAAGLAATLSPRQRQVLKEMAAGQRNKQIAWRLGLSEKTVKMHRALLLEKLGVRTTADAIRIAVEAGL
ncbi:MAG TPA: LuxR C-terminal-related transcriptional regulator [Allosphingosinicella sp.]|nr:LuxR C-terminal-related transcriptional regulator [Allosphingosinicella sp.]